MGLGGTGMYVGEMRRGRTPAVQIQAGRSEASERRDERANLVGYVVPVGRCFMCVRTQVRLREKA